MPVRGEEALVSKEAVVTGEVVLDRERVVERRQVTDTVRRERVELDEGYDRHRPGFRRHFDERQAQYGGQSGARTWEEAEPAYRYGYAAGRGEASRGREFDEVEPVLRGDYARRHGGGWERLREAIREGWRRGRGT